MPRRDRSPRAPRLTVQLRPLRATVAGVGAVAAFGLFLAQFGHVHTRAAQGLVLVVPVIVTAVLGGRRPAFVVSAAATLALSLLSPPVGTLRLVFTQDLIALVVFVAVAMVIGTVVAGQIELLGRVERQRMALLRSVSHDLRTPLSSIRAATTELLDNDHHDEAVRRRLLTLVADEAARLDRLVANLLSLSRIEVGAMEPRRQPIDLAELVGFCTERLDRLLDDRVLEVAVADDLPVIDADYAQLDQVLTNLLENAARHTPPGAAIRVRAWAEDERACFSVADSGPGVDPHDAEAIFEPFRSGAVAGASGIGLAICRAVVEAHGGTIGVGASREGGAEFTVTLPGRQAVP